jgi:hypothetical protein
LGKSLYVLIAFILIYFFIITFIAKAVKADVFKKRMGQASDSLCAETGIVILICGISYIYEMISVFSEGFDIFKLIYLFIGALGLVLAGLELFSKKRITFKSGFFIIMPAVMYVLRAINIFMHNLVIINISDELIRLLIDLSLGLFYFALGRMFIRSETKYSRFKVCFIGFFALTLIVGEALGKAVYLAMHAESVRRNLDHMQIVLPNLGFIMDGGVVFAVLLHLLRKGREKV